MYKAASETYLLDEAVLFGDELNGTSSKIVVEFILCIGNCAGLFVSSMVLVTFGDKSKKSEKVYFLLQKFSSLFAHEWENLLVVFIAKPENNVESLDGSSRICLYVENEEDGAKFVEGEMRGSLNKKASKSNG